jgi:hypothetical protein
VPIAAARTFVRQRLGRRRAVAQGCDGCHAGQATFDETPTLPQRLRVSIEHLNFVQRETGAPDQVVPDRDDRLTCNTQVGLVDEQIERGGHAPFEHIFDRQDADGCSAGFDGGDNCWHACQRNADRPFPAIRQRRNLAVGTGWTKIRD